tara:strand:+ start:5584 stop:6288 length:705 start_codon:yes stop_codon:yes gene_type:complete
MIVTIHQPEHMPWLGFFNKAFNCDIFVILDNVQFRKNYFQNRNQIISPCNGNSIWLTVPLIKGSSQDMIYEKQILYDNKFLKKYFKIIEKSYSNYPFYEKYITALKVIFDQETKSISRLNTKLIKYFFEILNIDCDVKVASDLSLPKSESGGIVNYDICNYLGASKYLSGKSGKDYLDLTPFKKNNIEVVFQDFNHPTYNQPGDNFVPNLSILDLLFSHEIDEIKKLIISSYKL